MAYGKQSKKKAQREEDLAEDEFLEKGRGVALWFEKHTIHVAGAMLAVFAIIVGIHYIGQMSARNASEITKELRVAVDAYREATDLRSVVTSTSPASLAKAYVEAQARFDEVASKFGDRAAGRLAKLYAADLARRQGKNDEAERLYRSYVESAKPDDVVAFVALEGLGYALEGQKKFDDAARAFDQLANGAPFFKDVGLEHKARVLEEKGDTQGALAAYRAIVAIEPPSPRKSVAESKIQSLE